jgi:hypothetical protein
MRIYIFGDDGIMLSRDTPTAVNEGEIAVASVAELRAAPLSGKRLLALWNALPGVEKRKKTVTWPISAPMPPQIATTQRGDLSGNTRAP